MENGDGELVARAIATHDQTAYHELLRRYQSNVRNWLRQLTRDPSLADDLAQETFIRAWERLHSIHDGSSFKSWLMKIAYNMFLQSRRKHVRELRLADALSREHLATEAHISQDPDPGLVDLPKMLASLSEEERIAMILCYAHGMSHREITELTGMALGTVKSHIRRGVLRIRESFDTEESTHE